MRKLTRTTKNAGANYESGSDAAGNVSGAAGGDSGAAGGIQVQWEAAQANRVSAEVMLLAMHEAQGCGSQDDELQAKFRLAWGGDDCEGLG